MICRLMVVNFSLTNRKMVIIKGRLIWLGLRIRRYVGVVTLINGDREAVLVVMFVCNIF